MIRWRSEAERDALTRLLREAYMEVFPTPTIEDRLGVMQANSYVALTCSPTRGVDETIDMTERLTTRGFRVIPHLAARAIRDRRHLHAILARLDALPVDSVFVPGGDAQQPVGDYATALELLRDIAEHGHRFRHVGVAAHPEGHPLADDDTLLEALARKAELATYMVTQMCFDAGALGRWLGRVRALGIGLPAWLGIPGVAERSALIRTSMRIGVGDSLRFLRRQGEVAAKILRVKNYTPDGLLSDLAPLLAEPGNGIAGFHVFCFNLVGATEEWRLAALGLLERAGAAPA